MQWSFAQYGTRVALLTAALSGLVGAGFGCGASHDGCMALAKANCDKQTQCSSYLAAVVASDMNYCLTQFTNGCAQSTSAADVTYGDASAAACAQAYGSLSCDDFFTGNLPAVCTPGGNRADGAACGNDYQCAAASYCNRMSGQCGTCAPLPTLNQACTGPCAGALQCVCAAGQTSCTTGTCQPFRKLGEMCDDNFGCLPSLACAKGLCATPMIGQACTSGGSECSSLQAQYCDQTSMTCLAVPFMITMTGDPCGASATNLYLCGVGLFCKTPTGADFGVCQPLPAAGTACGGNDGMTCASPATCVSGTCQNFDPNTCK
jgi:hypothetical protein